MREFLEEDSEQIKRYVEQGRVLPGPRRSVHLWEFLLELLMDESCASMIQWTDELNGEFKLKSSEDVARKWGQRKHKEGMNYDKLSRALRYYYSKDIIKKVSGRRFVYKFVPSPEMHAAVNAIKNHMVRVGIPHIPTGPFPHFQVNNEENNNTEHLKQDKAITSYEYPHMRPRSHSPRLEYKRTLPRPSPPMSASPPCFYPNEKPLPDNHIVLSHPYESKTLTKKFNDYKEIHRKSTIERFRMRLGSERELSSRDRELLSRGEENHDTRRLRVASTGDMQQPFQEERMRELKKFVYENSRQLRENGIRYNTRATESQFNTPLPQLEEEPLRKNKEENGECKKTSYLHRERFYSENYISLDSTVRKTDTYPPHFMERRLGYKKCCEDCPSSQQECDRSYPRERHYSSIDFRDNHYAPKKHFHTVHPRDGFKHHFQHNSHVHEKANDLKAEHYLKRSHSFDNGLHDIEHGSRDLKIFSRDTKHTSHALDFRMRELESNSVKSENNARTSRLKNSISPTHDSEMKPNTDFDQKSSDSDNDVFISHNHSNSNSHEGLIKQPKLASSPPPSMYYYRRYSPMVDVSTQTYSAQTSSSRQQEDEERESSMNIVEKPEEHTGVISYAKDHSSEVKKENVSPIQTRVITNGENHKFNFTTYQTNTSEYEHARKHSSPHPYHSTSSPTSIGSKKPCHCGCAGNNEHLNASENTVVVYPKEFV